MRHRSPSSLIFLQEQHVPGCLHSALSRCPTTLEFGLSAGDSQTVFAHVVAGDAGGCQQRGGGAHGEGAAGAHRSGPGRQAHPRRAQALPHTPGAAQCRPSQLLFSFVMGSWLVRGGIITEHALGFCLDLTSPSRGSICGSLPCAAYPLDAPCLYRPGTASLITIREI